MQGSTTSEDAHQALVVCFAVDIYTAHTVSLSIQGAGEVLPFAAYRRPGVCRSGGFVPACPVGNVVQQDVGGELAASGCVPCHAIRTVYYGREAFQLRAVGYQIRGFRRTATARKAFGNGAVPYSPGSVDLGRGLPVEPQFGEQAVFAARAKGQRQHGQEQRPENVYSRFHTK